VGGGAKLFLFSTPVQNGFGVQQDFSTIGIEALPWEYSGRGVAMTTHLHPGRKGKNE